MFFYKIVILEFRYHMSESHRVKPKDSNNGRGLKVVVVDGKELSTRISYDQCFSCVWDRRWVRAIPCWQHKIFRPRVTVTISFSLPRILQRFKVEIYRIYRNARTIGLTSTKQAGRFQGCKGMVLFDGKYSLSWRKRWSAGFRTIVGKLGGILYSILFLQYSTPSFVLYVFLPCPFILPSSSLLQLSTHYGDRKKAWDHASGEAN